MATPPPRLISTSSPPLANIFRFPPKPPISNQNFTAKSRSIDQSEEECRRQKQTLLSRRNAAFLSFLSLLPALSRPLPASAFSFGISGPKDWLKEQKRKASRFLLAPIYASRESLQSAYLLLNAADSIDREKDLEEVQKLLRSAGRDCVPQDRNSFVEFQANTGVEVCTFKLIVKNASSLLDDKNPVKLEAEVMLSDLIKSFTLLNGFSNETSIQAASSREKFAGMLMDTITSLDKFEQGVLDCLEV